MDISVDLGILLVALLPLALAMIGGGFVLFRKSVHVRWRALGMSAMTGGVGILLFFALVVPTSFSTTSEGEAPQPVISTNVTTG